MTNPLTRPNPGDPLSLSNGKPSTQIIDEAFDLVDAHEQALVGPAFRNVNGQTAVAAETLINDATAGSINPGTWFTRGNLDPGGFSTAFGRTSWQNGTLKLGIAEASHSTLFAQSGINFTTPVPVGANGVLSVWLLWAKQSAGSTFRNSDTRHPFEVLELVVSDGPTFTGNVVTCPLARDMSVNNRETYRQQFIQLYGLTTIKCIGVRQTDAIPYPDAFESKKIHQSTMSFATASELEVARSKATTGVFIPANYVPSVAHHNLPQPPDQGVVDLRASSNAGRVRYFEDFEDAVNDGSAPVDVAIVRAIHALKEGETLQFQRDAKYDCLAGGITIYNKKNITIDFNGATFYTTGATGTMWSVQHSSGVRFVSSGRRSKQVFKHDNIGAGAFNGSTLVGGGTVGTTKTLTTRGTAAVTPNAAWFGEDEDGFISADFTLSDTAAVAFDCYIELGQANAPAQPTGAVVGTSGGIPAGTYYYRLSWVDVEGKESGLSAPTEVVLPTWGQVTLTLPVPPKLRYGTPIVSKRLYRSTSLSQESCMDPVQSVPADWTTLNDNSSASYGNPPLSATLPAVTDAGAGNIVPGPYVWWVTQIDVNGRETMVDQDPAMGGINGCRAGTTSGQMTITLPSWTGVSRMRVYRGTSGLTAAWKAKFVGEPAFGVATWVDNVATPNPKLAPPKWVNESNAGAKNAPAPVMPETKLTLTTTPTSYSVKLRHTDRSHDDLMFWRIFKASSTANTITIHDYTNHTAQTRQSNSQSYGGVDRRDAQHAFAFSGSGCHDCHVENVSIIKPLGDAFFHQSGSPGRQNRGFTVKDVDVFANGRQTFAMMSGGDWKVENFVGIGAGGQFIDIEAEHGDRDTIELINVQVFNPKTSFIGTPDSSRNWTLKDCKFRSSYGNTGDIIITAFGINVKNCDFSYLPFTILGAGVYVDGLDVGAFVASPGFYRAHATGGESLDPEGAVIKNVRLTPVKQTGPVFTVQFKTSFVSNISTTYPFNAFADQVNSALDGGPFQIAGSLSPFVQADSVAGIYTGWRGTASAALLDPGPWKTRYPDTWKGTIVGTDPHFPTGLDMLEESVRNVRGISSTATRPNNLRVAAPVTAGATTATLSFPNQSYADLTFITGSAAATPLSGILPAGSLAAGTYYYRVAARTAQGGPRPTVSAEAVIAISGANNSTLMTFGNFVGATALVEGFTLYRGTASNVYTTRFDLFPNSAVFSMLADTNGQHAFVDTGANLRGPGGGVGYPDLITPTPTTEYVGSSAWDGTKWIASVNQTGWEPDKQYTVLVDTSWATTVGVTTRRPSGFDLAFGTAAPVGASVSCVIVR